MSPPLPPPPPPPPDADAAASARDRAYRAEADAAEDPALRAVWLYEAAAHLEARGEAPLADLLQVHLAAFKADPTFTPPFDALVRWMERRRALQNLQRVLAAGTQAATDALQAASLHLDLAALAEDALQQPRQAAEHLADALEALGEEPALAALPLYLELHARSQGERVLLLEALRLRIQHAPDALAALLRLERAVLEAEETGNGDPLLGAIQEASASERPEVRREAARIGWQEAGSGDRPALGRESLLLMAQEASNPSGATALGLQGPEAPLLLATAWSAWRLQDPDAALKALAQVQGKRPEAAWVASLRAGILVERGEHDEAVSLLDTRTEGEDATSALRLRWRARSIPWLRGQGDAERSIATLQALASAHSPSPAAEGMWLEALARQQEPERSLSALRRLAEAAPQGPEAARAWWRLAHATDALGGPAEDTSAALRAALQASEEPKADLLRDAMRLAENLGDIELAASLRSRLEAREDLDPAEREALAAEALLRAAPVAALPGPAPNGEAAPRWVLPWTWGAMHHAGATSWEQLASLHERLATEAEAEEVGAAHWLAAARSWLLAEYPEAAERAAREALARAPEHPYAAALLEAMLRRQGRADDLAEWLRGQGGSQAREALVVAAATASRNGDVPRAMELLREAATDAPQRTAPWWALLFGALETQREEDRREALEGLLDASGSEATRLELGALLGWREPGDPEEAQRLWEESSSSEGRAVAAWHMLLWPRTRSGSTHMALALDLLGQDEPCARAWSARQALWAALRDEAAPPQPDSFTPGSAEQEVSSNANVEGALAAWIATSLQAPQDPEAVESWSRLARETADPEVRAALLVQAARTRLVSGGEGATEEAFMLAIEATEEHPGSVGAWALLEETTGVGDDPAIRLQALESRLTRAAGPARRRIACARGRALISAGRAEEALTVLHAVVQEDDGDLGAWEALRQAAWAARSWPVAAEAAERLADRVDGSARAALLEEAAALRMDHLDDLSGAERRLRDALEADPSRRIAFERLHDVLAARDRPEELLELVRRRIPYEEDAERGARLRYEEARLLRASGQREEALEALEALLRQEPDNPGAIALGVEILTSLRRWEETVAWLRRLAEADAPAEQRRLARMGAADFLHHKLGRPAEALEELRAAERLGPPDARLLRRIARLAREAEHWEEAAEALEAAAALSEGPRAAELWREAAELREERLGDASGARQRWWRALDAAPGSLELAEQLARRLEEGEQRKELAEAVERTARERLERDPLDPEGLRLLERAAEWGGDRDLRWRCLHALVTLGIAEDSERSRESRLRPDPPAPPWRALDAERLAALRPETESLPWHILGLAGLVLAQVAGRTPEALGVGRAERLRGAHPWRRILDGMASALLLPEAADIYVGGPAEHRIWLAIDRKGRPCWVVGRGVGHPPEPSTRFHVGAEAWGHLAGATGLLDLEPDAAATRLAALWSACERPLRGAPPTPRQQVEQLREALGRRGRRALAEALPESPGFDVLQRFAEAVRLASSRAGLLYAGTLEPAGREPEAWAWWTSHPFGNLRKALGWSP